MSADQIRQFLAHINQGVANEVISVGQTLVVQLFVILSIGTVALSGGRQELVREEELPAETILILQPSARRRVK